MFVILLTNIGLSFGMEVAMASDFSESLINARRKKLESYMISKVRPITQAAEIINIPMRDIRCSIEKLSSEQQQKIKDALVASLTFNIAMLPKEVCLNILYLAYDKIGQRYNGNSFFCMPMSQAISLNHEFQKSPIKIGGKPIELSTFLLLTQEERNKISSIAHPSPLNQFFVGINSDILTKEDHDTVIQILPELDQAEKLTVLPPFWDRAKVMLFCKCSPIGPKALLLGLVALVIPQFFLAIGSASSDDDPVASAIFYSIGGMSDVAVLLGMAYKGITCGRDHIIEEAQNNRAI
jgi:hypothetical protein